MKKTITPFFILFFAVFTAFGQSSYVGPNSILLKTYGNIVPAILATSVSGTPEAPVNTTAGRPLLAISARGFVAGGPNIFTANIEFKSEENFTASSQATGISFSITKPNTFVPQLGMTLSSKGFLAIGNLTPNAPLQFANTISNRKIVMVEQANNDHEFTGFGVGGGIRYQIPNTTEAHIFYAGASANSSNELMRIQGNGNVGIGTSNATDAKLQISGGASRGLQSSSISETGVRGLSTSSTGVLGESDSGNGVNGSSSSGIGVIGESQTGQAVRGVSQTGIGVAAFSTSNQAVYGNNNSASNPTARFDNMASGGNALHVEGGIKVSGSSPAALRIEASNDVFSLPVPTASTNAQTDLLFVTRATGISGGTGTSYYAKWTGSEWEIRREDNGTITAGTNLNVLVIKQ